MEEAIGLPEDEVKSDDGEAPADALVEAAPTAVATHEAVFRVVDLTSIDVELPTQHPQITLQEAEAPYRQLVIPIGLPEGVALAHAFRRIETPRPLTHELFASVLGRLNADVIAVRLVGRVAGVYEAELDLMGTAGRQVLSCRPTDAVTLALRMPVPAPMLVDERLLTETGDVRAG